MNKKILLSTKYIHDKNDIYDYVATNTRSMIFRYTFPRHISYGLRFIKQNIPEIDIIEYPTLDKYLEKLKEGWDIVGFSFYQNDIPEIFEMLTYAKQFGVKEFWAGNYGALTKSIQKYFDKIFIGYSEYDIAELLGKNIDKITHPPLFGYVGTQFGIKVNYAGILFTGRGCSIGCNFCQTPAFCKKPETIPLDSIDGILKYYQGQGTTEIVILDENFGLFKDHSENVISLLNKYGFYWFVMTRADFLAKRLDNWISKGLLGAFIGIESFNQTTLESISKKEKTDVIINCIKKLQQKNRFVIGYYIIGFPNETVDSIKEDVKKLKELKLDVTQLCILTPFPETPMWKSIDEEFGIFEKDWHKYDTKHLVWNHPNISPEKMQELLNWSLEKIYPNKQFFRTGRKFLNAYIEDKGSISGLNYAFKHFLHANTFDPNRITKNGKKIY